MAKVMLRSLELGSHPGSVMPEIAPNPEAIYMHKTLSELGIFVQFFQGRTLKLKELRKCGSHWIVYRYSRSSFLLCIRK